MPENKLNVYQRLASVRGNRSLFEEKEQKALNIATLVLVT